MTFVLVLAFSVVFGFFSFLVGDFDREALTVFLGDLGGDFFGVAAGTFFAALFDREDLGACFTGDFLEACDFATDGFLAVDLAADGLADGFTVDFATEGFTVDFAADAFSCRLATEAFLESAAG